MKKTILITLSILYASIVSAGTIQDTIDYPYWKSMLQESWTKINIHKVKRAYDLYFSNKPKVKGTGWKIFERWYENYAHIAHPDGTLPNPNHAANELRKFRRNNLTPRGSETGNWKSMGPNKKPTNGFWAGGAITATAMSGRINTIAFHPTDSNKIWLGTPQGGLWSSTNGGQNWSSNTDNLPSLGVSTIAIFPDSNKMIIGTGDRDANDAYGRGIMISRDNGSTWTQIAQLNTRKINKIAVNPQNKRTLLVATDSGLYRSYDQGNTFSMITDGSTPLDVAILDVQYKLGDSSIALATRASQLNSTNTAIYVITGTTYTSHQVNSPNAVRGILATTSANPNIMYALFAKSAPVSSVYKIDVATASITTTKILDDTTFNILGYAKNGATHTDGQGFYDISLCGSPTDSNFIAVGGINVFTSNNIGANWTCRAYWNADPTGGVLPEVHADHHYMAYNPLNNKYYLGTDGGIYSTSDFNTYTPLNNDLGISQFYDIDVSQADSGIVVGGLQDNANLMKKNGLWSVHIGGDGMVAEVNDKNPNVIVGSSQNGSLELSLNGYSSATTRIGDGDGKGIDEAGPWVTHHEMNPFTPSFHIVGTKTKMFYNRKVNDSANFNYDSIASIQGNNFTSIRHSRKDSMMAIAADEGGSFYILKNLLNGTLSYTKKKGPDSTVKLDDIEFNHNTSNIVYAISDKKVYKSEDTGTTWVDISGNLPSVAKYTLLNDKNTDGGIYVGTEIGVFYKDNSMTNWIMFSTNLPLTSQIRDMEIWYDTICSYGSKIYLGTYGRSAWIGDVYQKASSALSTNFSIPSSEYKDAQIQISNTTQNSGSSPTYKWTISPNTYTYGNGTNASSTSPSIIFNATGKYTITLYAKNNNTNEFCTIKKDTVINIIINTNMVTINRPLTNSICAGDTLIFIASNSAGYAWSPNSGISSTTGTTVKVYPSTTTTYKVKGNNNDSVEFLVTVNPKPVVVITPPSASIVSGTSTQLTASGADTYLWSPSTGLNTTTSASVVASPVATITYTVEGTKSGCKGMGGITVTVTNNPNKVTINRPLTNSICAGDTLIFIASNSAGYAWSPNSGISSTTGTTVKVYPSTTTTYKVKGDNNDSVEFLVTVNPKPVVVISPPSASIVSGTSTQLTASGADTYLWSPSTGLNTTTSASVVASPVATITYTVEGTKSGCKGMGVITITVTKPNSIYFDNMDGIKIYPIPASNKLFVECLEPLEYNITSLEGKVIKSGKLQLNNVILLDNISNGNYFIELRNKSSKKMIYRISIIH